jgi:hypothetical protein
MHSHCINQSVDVPEPWKYDFINASPSPPLRYWIRSTAWCHGIAMQMTSNRSWKLIFFWTWIGVFRLMVMMRILFSGMSFGHQQKWCKAVWVHKPLAVVVPKDNNMSMRGLWRIRENSRFAVWGVLLGVLGWLRQKRRAFVDDEE